MGNKPRNCEVTSQANWPIAKRDGPKVLTAFHGILGLKFNLFETASAITPVS
jgi:hypothetical protein